MRPGATGRDGFLRVQVVWDRFPGSGAMDGRAGHHGASTSPARPITTGTTPSTRKAGRKHSPSGAAIRTPARCARASAASVSASRTRVALGPGGAGQGGARGGRAGRGAGEGGGRRVVLAARRHACAASRAQFEQAGDPPQGGAGGAVERLGRRGDGSGHRQPGFETDRQLGPRRGQRRRGRPCGRGPCGEPAKDHRKPERRSPAARTPAGAAPVSAQTSRPRPTPPPLETGPADATPPGAQPAWPRRSRCRRTGRAGVPSRAGVRTVSSAAASASTARGSPWRSSRHRRAQDGSCPGRAGRGQPDPAHHEHLAQHAATRSTCSGPAPTSSPSRMPSTGSPVSTAAVARGPASAAPTRPAWASRHRRSACTAGEQVRQRDAVPFGERPGAGDVPQVARDLRPPSRLGGERRGHAVAELRGRRRRLPARSEPAPRRPPRRATPRPDARRPAPPR